MRVCKNAYRWHQLFALQATGLLAHDVLKAPYTEASLNCNCISSRKFRVQAVADQVTTSGSTVAVMLLTWRVHLQQALVGLGSTDQASVCYGAHTRAHNLQVKHAGVIIKPWQQQRLLAGPHPVRSDRVKGWIADV